MMPISDMICKPILEGSPDAYPNAFGILGAGWLELSLLALLTSLLILTLVHIFSNFLRNPQLTTWTKFELFQVLATAGIILFTGTIIFGMCSFDMGFVDPARYNGMNMYDIIDEYFARLELAAFYLFTIMARVVKILAFMSKIVMYSNPLGVGSVESPLESLGQINSVIFYLLSGFVISFMLIQLQMRMLEYFALAALHYLYPFGIFFRAFEPTRSFGGTLIAISISLFLFYPMILVLNDHIITGQVERAMGASGGMEDELEIAEKSLDPADPKVPDENRIAQEKGDLANRAEFNSFIEGISGGFLFFMRPLMLYVIAAVVLPIINFIVLVEITKALSKLLGEEIDVSNLTRLI